MYTFGTTGADRGPEGHYLDIAAFLRETHGGTALDFDGNQFPYEAIRIE